MPTYLDNKKPYIFILSNKKYRLGGITVIVPEIEEYPDNYLRDTFNYILKDSNGKYLIEGGK